MKYAIYDPTEVSAMIVQIVTGYEDDAKADSDPMGLAYIAVDESVSDRYYYINTNDSKAYLRPDTSYSISDNTIFADGESSIVIGDLVSGTKIDVKGPVSGSVDVEGDSESIQFDIPGEYQINIIGPFPARPLKVTVNAT